MDDWLSPADLALACKVSTSTVYRWIRQGKLGKPMRRQVVTRGWPRQLMQRFIDERRGQQLFPFGEAA